ncbi:MAG: alpha/beta hydrolase [Gammaproteobacteria bacterium]|nr:alpha/beta hydrolase [Gammaproteobacteria bacterium]
MHRRISTLAIAATILLVACTTGVSRAADGPETGVGIDLLTATPEAFCTTAQRIVSNTKIVGQVTVHADVDDFVRSKTGIRPLSLHGFVWTDQRGRAVALSCKLKSADHLNAIHGDGAAGPDGLCQDMNRATYHQVRQALGAGTAPRVLFDADEDVFDDADPASTGRRWLERFELAYLDAAGNLHVRAKGFRVDWTDPRFAMLEGRGRGVHYCHFIAPGYLLDIAAGRADAGATVGRAVVAKAAAPTAKTPAADTLRYSTVSGSDGVPLNVVEAGPPDAPGILFIHGFSQTYLSFDAQLRDVDLAREFHLVAFDLRGHGNSGKPWETASYSDRLFADDVMAVMRATGLTRPVVVAWSFGGLVTMHYIRHYGADQLGGLNLVGTTGRLVQIPVREPGDPQNPMDTNWARLTLSNSIADNLHAIDLTIDMLTGRPMPDEWQHRTRNAAMTMPAYAKRAIGADPGDNTDLAGAIDIPLLFSAGWRDPIVPFADVLTTAQALARVRVSVYDESGHSPFAEEPERFNGELAAFVRAAQDGEFPAEQ